MAPPLFDQLQQTLASQGPAAAIEQLCRDLRDRKEYGNLFYALLMKKRHELGASPVATGSNQDLPAEVHQAFEDGIRQAALTVGGLYLDDGNIPQAWGYFRMLGETETVRQALEKLKPGPDEDLQPIIDIAFHQAVHPRQGFDWILDATAFVAPSPRSAAMAALAPDARNYCIQRLVRLLHADLVDASRPTSRISKASRPPRRRSPNCWPVGPGCSRTIATTSTSRT